MPARCKSAIWLFIVLSAMLKVRPAPPTRRLSAAHVTTRRLSLVFPYGTTMCLILPSRLDVDSMLAISEGIMPCIANSPITPCTSSHSIHSLASVI